MVAQRHQSQPPVPATTWQSRSVSLLAGVFLVVGLIAGYLYRGALPIR